jgi:response regulator RpfG family c-di-GMP phosphodiesterase
MASINSVIELHAKANGSRGDHGMARILIVEDEPNMVAGLRDNLEYEGYEVITAPDGVAGPTGYKFVG